MAITSDLVRDLSTQTETITVTWVYDTVTENDANDTFTQPVCITITPPTFNVASANVTTGSDTITGSFDNDDVRVGDTITGTSIDTGTTVVSKTNTEIVITPVAIGTATETITVDPGTFNATVFIIEQAIGSSGKNASLGSTIYRFDGTLASAGKIETPANAVNATTAVAGQIVQVDIDDFYINARIPRN